MRSRCGRRAFRASPIRCVGERIMATGVPEFREVAWRACSLDWAIQNGVAEWGVTLLAAQEEMDMGDIWATKTFPMRNATKSSLFNREVTQGAVDCLWEALSYFDAPDFKPVPLDYNNPMVKGKLQPMMKQADRALNWKKQSTDEILRHLHQARHATSRNSGTPVAIIRSPTQRMGDALNALRPQRLRTKAASSLLPHWLDGYSECNSCSSRVLLAHVESANCPVAYQGLKITTSLSYVSMIFSGGRW
ncbi:hypothetical protein [Bathymodiolus japonicus methanotrophic gill symbiont]|uniref:hypothetical protein n=2 Tax=Bathymodiolus japonicus methanotrophic gill symbiont TaxID=113269 RepID=UPI001C8DCD31|nr:hypothetical protein [Bathymodiolus japonicus methanotrophic gill symbiont]